MKRLCAKAALDWCQIMVRSDLEVGRRSAIFVNIIKEAGKAIEAITPSDQTKKVCKQLGITVIDINEAQDVTIAFDGCDEVDQNLNAYKKWWWGFIQKEKIIAKMAQEYVLLVDETKVVEKLDCKVPIVLEIVPEAASYVTKEAKKLGAKVKERNEKLLELYFEGISDLKKLDQDLKQITGVIEISLFYQIAAKVVVAGTDGIKIIES